MKKVLFASVIAAVVMLGDTLSVKAGWQLFGISDSIGSMSAFATPSGCVNAVWVYRDGNYYGYTPTGGDNIRSLNPSEGFWIKANNSCYISFSAGSAIPTFTKSDSTVTLSPDQSGFAIALSSNPTTGYSWKVSAIDSNIFQIPTNKYNPQTTSAMVVGAGGTDVWIFALKDSIMRPLDTNITMSYGRSWEPKPIETVVFSIKAK